MKSNIASMIVLIVLLIVGCIVLPTYFRSIEETRDDAVRVQNAARNFVDLVIDNQIVAEEYIADLNLELSACDSIYSYRILRDERIVTPDTSSASGYSVSWVAREVGPGDKVLQGDFITIEIKQETMSLNQRIAAMLSSASYNKYDVRFTAMVR